MLNFGVFRQLLMCWQEKSLPGAGSEVVGMGRKVQSSEPSRGSDAAGAAQDLKEAVVTEVP
jgi:hypothetical protein